MLCTARLKTLILALFTAPCLVFSTVSNAQTGYTITRLSGLGLYDNGLAVNFKGQITGLAGFVSGVYHAFRCTGTTMEDLGPPVSDSCRGYSINASGQVAGWSDAPNAIRHAVRWTGTSAVDLGTFGGNTSEADGINDNGDVVGYANFAGNSISHAFRYSGTTLQDLGTLGGDSSYAYGINNSGQIAGHSQTAGNAESHAVRWNGASMEDLGTLGGKSSVGRVINASGQVAGYSILADNTTQHAVLWTGTTAQDIDTSGNAYSEAFGINSFGDVVGDSSKGAFLYTSGRMIPLSTLVPAGSVWTTLHGRGINDDGWITGWGFIGGSQSGFLLKPVASTGASRIALEGVNDLTKTSSAAPLGTFHVSLRTPGTTTELFRKNVTLTPPPGSAFGTYTLTGVPNGKYDIAIQGGKSLRVIISNFTINGTASLPDVTLPAGDANNDNSIDVGDFGLLVNAYNGDATKPGSGYNSQADFNYDGVVDVADFGLLVNEYGSVGAP